MSFGSAPTPPALPQTPAPNAPPPLFGAQQSMAAKKPQNKSFNPTFLGTGAAPSPAQLGAKTLLGQ